MTSLKTQNSPNATDKQVAEARSRMIGRATAYEPSTPTLPATLPAWSAMVKSDLSMCIEVREANQTIRCHEMYHAERATKDAQKAAL